MKEFATRRADNLHAKLAEVASAENGTASLPKLGYTHKRVNHSENVHVSGEIHVNTMEGFWSLVKRGIVGVYHSCLGQTSSGLPERVCVAL